MSTVYKNPSDLKIATAKHALRDAGIETFILNKSSSAYVGLFGADILVNVVKEKSEEAIEILREGGFYDEEEEE